MIPPRSWRDSSFQEAFLERVIVPGWHLLTDDRAVRAPGSWATATLLPGCLDEPVLLTFDGERLRGFANVCTHRLARLADGAGTGRTLVCPYHARSFALDGTCRGQPHLGRPTPADDLVPLAVARWNGLIFASLGPAVPFDRAFGPLGERLGVLDLTDGAVEDGPDYVVEGPAVAWIENYLEGLHLPWVHPALDAVVDRRDYRVEALPGGSSLQVGPVGPDTPALPLPTRHPHADLRAGGLYGFLFPLTALNLYPWGLSVNLVQPLGPWRTRIRYRRVVVDRGRLGDGAGGALDTVEAEDQAIVARVVEGLRSRLAPTARPLPGPEDAVLAWHRAVLAAVGPEELTPR
jgi:choline monooxygenase